MMSWHGSAFHITGPLWGKSTSHRWIPFTKGQWCRTLMLSLMLAWKTFEQTAERQVEMSWCWFDITVMMAEIFLCMCPANERRRYNVTSSLIGWVHTQNDPWITHRDLITNMHLWTESSSLVQIMDCSVTYSAPSHYQQQRPIIVYQTFIGTIHHSKFEYFYSRKHICKCCQLNVSHGGWGWMYVWLRWPF